MIKKLKNTSKEGSDSSQFPKDEGLPWHYSYIDAPDLMIGGMSLPCERMNYKSILKEGVGLIVNLTETPVTPNSLMNCSTCSYDRNDNCCDEDIFDDISHEDNLQCLLLPLQDGQVPTFKQVELFLKHAQETIDRGKKVAVHCHAGVGRTGTFLCIYLMVKYALSPKAAIEALRQERPQSMQYCPEDWYSDPYLMRTPDEYLRNYRQEEFVYEYYSEVLFPSLQGSPALSFASVETLQNQSESVENSLPNSDHSIVSVNTEEAEPSESNCDDELAKMFDVMNLEKNEDDQVQTACHHCRGILAVGPALIARGSVWPPKGAKILYS